MFILQMPDNVSLERDSQGRMTCEVCGYKTTVSVMSNICFWTVFILKHWTKVHVFNAKRVSFSRMQLLVPMVLKPLPIPVLAKIGYSLRSGRGGSLDCMWGVQTHSAPPEFLVPFGNDLARINGTPPPNRKWLPALGIEPGSLDHGSQSLTIRPFLTCCYYPLLDRIRRKLVVPTLKHRGLFDSGRYLTPTEVEHLDSTYFYAICWHK